MTQNKVLKTIYSRRAVRKFKDQEVNRNLIEEIIEAGRMAPSAINMQPWGFRVITKKEKIQAFSKVIKSVAAKQVFKMETKAIVKSVVSAVKLSHGVDFLKGRDAVFHEAPVVIFITADKDNEWAPIDIGMCAQNMMLAAKSMELDTCPIGFAKFVNQTELYPDLKIPDSHKVLLAVIVGYGDESPEVHERIKDNVDYV